MLFCPPLELSIAWAIWYAIRGVATKTKPVESGL